MRQTALYLDRTMQMYVAVLIRQPARPLLPEMSMTTTSNMTSGAEAGQLKQSNQQARKGYGLLHRNNVTIVTVML